MSIYESTYLDGTYESRSDHNVARCVDKLALRSRKGETSLICDLCAISEGSLAQNPICNAIDSNENRPS